MYIRITRTPNSPRRSVQVVETYREAGKVKQKIVRHVGVAHSEAEEAAMKTMAETTIIPHILKEREKALGQLSLFEVERVAKKGRPRAKKVEDILPVSQVNLEDVVETDRVIEGIQEVGGKLFDELGFGGILAGQAGGVLKDVVLARMAIPSSKKKSCELLGSQFGREISEDRVYRMMDKLSRAIPRLQEIVRQSTQKLFKQKVSLLLFDVTTLYFESVEDDELRAHGFSKDQKGHMTQVVLALATTQEGLPMGYELFKGNTAETKTLIASIEAWKAQGLAIEDICFVADRAMFNDKNLTLLESKGMRYVVAAKLKQLPDSLQATCLSDDYAPWAHNGHLIWGKEIMVEPKKKKSKNKLIVASENAEEVEKPDSGQADTGQPTRRRLIVTYSAARHRKDLKERDSILSKIELKLSQGMSTLITNKAYKSFLTQQSLEEPKLDLSKVQAAARWDGLHGIITNIPDRSPTDLLTLYHRLWMIEDAFRLNKHSLKMRPIYHFKPHRIKAHIAICYLAFALARHLQYRVALTQLPLSFDKIREDLLSVQASILTHKKTNDRYRLPSKFSQSASKIYRALGIKRSLDASIYLN